MMELTMNRLIILTIYVWTVFGASSVFAFDGLSAKVSLGQGLLFTPDPVGAGDPTTLALGISYQVNDFLRADVDIVPALRQRRQGAFDLQVRASALLDPFNWIYFRVSTGAVQLLQTPASFMLGLAVGSHFELRPGFLLFGEVGPIVHQDTAPSSRTQLHGFIEGRLGATYELPL
jgi:hypothetical protein